MMYKIITIILLAVTFGYAQESYKFSELRGLEDKDGNTQLFYRLYSYSPEYSSWWGPYEENSVYRYEPVKDSQYYFLHESGWRAVEYLEINDFNFPGNDYNNYFYLNTLYTSTEPTGAIIRNDKYLASFSNLPELFWQTGRKIELSRQDTNYIFAAFDGYNYLSTDYGETWARYAENYHLISVSPFDHNVCFAFGPGGLHKSTDMGNTFILADTGNYYNSMIYYDSDSLHIYLIKNRKEIFTSENKGAPFTWDNCYSALSGEAVITIDTSYSGSLYIADGREIYHSVDYGKSFSLYKTLDRSIIGLYKKPGSDVLFAATSYDLYSIRPDSTIILKHLPQGNEIIEWYPLVKGNKWYYDYEFSIDTDYVRRKAMWEVTDYIKQPGGSFVKLSVMEKTSVGSATIQYELYLEIDSLDGKIYIAIETGDTLARDVLIGDFTMNKGDTVQTEGETFFTCTEDGAGDYFGHYYNFKKFYNSAIMTEYTFLHGVGLMENKFNELSFSKNTLYGAVINGAIIGDTLLTDVNPENIVIHEFSLSQNYPNPFNPVTAIKYSIKEQGNVSLKVFDILGKEVASLVNEDKPAGDYEVNFNGSSLASGVYIYRLTSGTFSQSKKLILIK